MIGAPGAGPSPRLDLEVLLGHLAGLARDQLERRGALVCMGAYLARGGGITNLVVEPPEDGSGLMHLASTRRALGGMGQATAAAAAADLVLSAPSAEGMTDAVVIDLDHRAPGEGPLRVLWPYRRRRSRGPSFGAMTTGPGDAIFPPPRT